MDPHKAIFPSNWQKQLQENGHFAITSVLDDTAKALVEQQDWQGLDAYFQELTQENGALFKLMSEFVFCHDIEFIISIRDAENDWEEDGIWHDDGSRKLAFSLSLTAHPEQIEGGILEMRKKGEINSLKIKPFAYGTMIVFATGVSGFEHRINQVRKGRRIIIAGWCQ